MQAIRQTGLNGDLDYYSDPRLASGIRLPSGSILLPPRAAVNVRFVLDPSSLPPGGVYAAIFFQTVPPPVHAPGSRINQALRLGTLLLLQNGYKGTAKASIESLQLPNFSYAHSLIGSAVVNNRGTLAFYPQLSARVNGFHAGMKVGSPYILPASRRQLQFELTGNYIGPIHIVFADRQHQLVASDWIWVVTGYWQWLLPTIVVVIFSFIGYRFRVGHRSPVYTVSKGRGDVK